MKKTKIALIALALISLSSQAQRRGVSQSSVSYSCKDDLVWTGNSWTANAGFNSFNHQKPVYILISPYEVKLSLQGRADTISCTNPLIKCELDNGENIGEIMCSGYFKGVNHPSGRGVLKLSCTRTKRGMRADFQYSSDALSQVKWEGTVNIK